MKHLLSKKEREQNLVNVQDERIKNLEEMLQPGVESTTKKKELIDEKRAIDALTAITAEDTAPALAETQHKISESAELLPEWMHNWYSNVQNLRGEQPR